MIENDAPLPVQGAYELRMLAYTYNLMYDINRRNRNNLLFKADHDALTGALNRNAFERIQEATEEGKLAFLILDIDNFKQINDKYGHLVGDRVLIKVVGLIRKNFRADDCIFRIGGDEFVIVLFGIDKDSRSVIQNIFKRINDALAKDPQEGDPEVTISAGVAFGEKIDEELMRHADHALYKSKGAGKSTCSFYED